MSSPPPNATPEQMRKLIELNKRLYGSQNENPPPPPPSTPGMVTRPGTSGMVTRPGVSGMVTRPGETPSGMVTRPGTSGMVTRPGNYVGRPNLNPNSPDYGITADPVRQGPPLEEARAADLNRRTGNYVPPQPFKPGKPNVMGFPDEQPTQQSMQQAAGGVLGAGGMRLPIGLVMGQMTPQQASAIAPRFEDRASYDRYMQQATGGMLPRPSTSGMVTRPGTSGMVTRPGESGMVTRPGTSGMVTRPGETPSGMVTRPGGPQAVAKPAFKKGGKVSAKAPVKKAAGGKVAAKAPVKKAMGGKVAAKPMSRPVAKAKPMARPMPAMKRGGKVMMKGKYK